jgi:hypothetical protein
MVQIDTISNAGFVLRNNLFTDTNCNLGRYKSSHSLIEGNTFRNAKIPSLELSWLPQVRQHKLSCCQPIPSTCIPARPRPALLAPTCASDVQSFRLYCARTAAAVDDMCRESSFNSQFFEGPVVLRNVTLRHNTISGTVPGITFPMLTTPCSSDPSLHPDPTICVITPYRCIAFDHSYIDVTLVYKIPVVAFYLTSATATGARRCRPSATPLWSRLWPPDVSLRCPGPPDACMDGQGLPVLRGLLCRSDALGGGDSVTEQHRRPDGVACLRVAKSIAV